MHKFYHFSTILQRTLLFNKRLNIFQLLFDILLNFNVRIKYIIALLIIHFYIIF